jgi:hypothetical protein
MKLFPINRIRKAILMLVIVAPAILTIKCSKNSESRICLIAPRGYTGPIAIVENPDSSRIVNRNNEYQIFVAENGIGEYKDLSILYEWHQSYSRAPSGDIIPENKFFEGGSSRTKRGNRVAYFYLGDESDFQDFYLNKSASGFRKRKDWLVERGLD